MFLLATLLLLSGPKNPPPNPADYTVAIHVQASHLNLQCTTTDKGSDCGYVNRLDVTIDGKKFELEDYDGRDGLIHIGDYKAKLLEGPEPRAYEFKRYYEFLFSDGKTRKFRVAGESE